MDREPVLHRRLLNQTDDALVAATCRLRKTSAGCALRAKSARAGLETLAALLARSLDPPEASRLSGLSPPFPRLSRNSVHITRTPPSTKLGAYR